MEANQITGSKDNPLPASAGNAVGRMETLRRAGTLTFSAWSYSLIMVAGNEELEPFKHKQKPMHFKCPLEVGIFPSFS